MRTIYVFGNPILNFDNTPIKLVPELQKKFPDIKFVIQDPNENLHPENKELIIIDTALDIDKVKILDDIDKIQLSPQYSLHDFDLGFNLKLLKKIGKLEKVTIFCVPPDIKQKQALDELVSMISKFNFSSNQ
jgi:Ni,Fe-hydrogenase maturation factor